jgi:hypothetical protein
VSVFVTHIMKIKLGGKIKVLLPGWFEEVEKD